MIWRVVCIAIAFAVCATDAAAQSDAAWERIGHRCEAVIAQSEDARFRDLYLACLFGVASAEEREEGRRLGGAVRESAARAIMSIDDALRSGGGEERDIWVRARAGALPLAQARGGVLLLATETDEVVRSGLPGEIVSLMNGASGRDDAQAAAMRALPGSAALALGEYETAVELYTQAVHVVSSSSDRDSVLRAHGAEIAMGSALAAARVGGAARGREVLERAMRDEPFTGKDGINAHLMLAGTDALARLELETNRDRGDAIDRICTAYSRLLRRRDLAPVRGVLRTMVVDRMGRVIPEGMGADELPTLGALARASVLIDGGRKSEASSVLEGVRRRGDLLGDDLSHCLRMQAASAEGTDALGYLIEHAEVLGSHEHTPGVVRTGGRIAAGVLRGGGSGAGDIENARRMARVIRDQFPEADPGGDVRAALAAALSRRSKNIDALIEAAETWHAVRMIDGWREQGAAGEVVCRLGALLIADKRRKHAFGQALLLSTTRGDNGALENRRALVIASRVIGHDASGDPSGAARELKELIQLDRIEPENDRGAVAFALDVGYGVVHELGAGRVSVIISAHRLVGADARGVVELGVEDAGGWCRRRFGGFWALQGNAVGSREDEQMVDVLTAARVWAVEHDGSMVEAIERLLAGSSIGIGDLERAGSLLEGMGTDSETRYLRGELALARGDAEGAFGVYRALAERADAARDYGAIYFRCWVRMLEILASRGDTGARHAEIRGEAERLLAHEGIGAHPECARRLRTLVDGMKNN